MHTWLAYEQTGAAMAGLLFTVGYQIGYVNILASYTVPCCWPGPVSDLPPSICARTTLAVAGRFWLYAGPRGLTHPEPTPGGGGWFL